MNILHRNALHITALVIFGLAGVAKAQSVVTRSPLTISGTISVSVEHDTTSSTVGVKTTDTTLTTLKILRFTNRQILAAMVADGTIPMIDGYSVVVEDDGSGFLTTYAIKAGLEPTLVDDLYFSGFDVGQGGMNATDKTVTNNDTGDSWATTSGTERAVGSVHVLQADTNLLGTSIWLPKTLQTGSGPLMYTSSSYSGRFFGLLDDAPYDPTDPRANGIMEGTLKIGIPTSVRVAD